LYKREQKNAANAPGPGGMKIKPKYVLIALSLALVLAVALLYLRGNGQGNDLTSFNYFAMDTLVEMRFVSVDNAGDEEIIGSVIAEIERLEALLSRSETDSDVVAINRAAGQQAVAVSPETLALIEEALYFAEISGGAFDPTIAPLTDAWGFWDQAHRLPADEELARALELVDYSMVELDPEKKTVYLPLEEMALELGGIAKGYIVDRALELLSSKGVTSAFVNAGGDIGLIGLRPDGEPWKIGVGHPREEGAVIVVIPLSGGAVVTSGDYRRFFEEDGVIYHHIIDPATGYPAGDLISVTITAPTVMEADALSTAVFVLGPEAGMSLVESLPHIEGILIGPGLEIYLSSGLEGLAELRQ